MYKDMSCFKPHRGAGEEVEEEKKVQNSQKHLLEEKYFQGSDL